MSNAEGIADPKKVHVIVTSHGYRTDVTIDEEDAGEPRVCAAAMICERRNAEASRGFMTVQVFAPGEF